jgi:SAM-dependent methyltransferase
LASSWKLDQIVIPELVTSTKKRFLDVACGFGKWGAFLKKNSYASCLIGVDIWKPYLKHLKKRSIFDELVLASATHLPFVEKSFDVVIACEVIEHLPKHLGTILRLQCESLAREKIILSTPNFHYHQGIEHNNPFEKHISFWKDNDFKKAGYKVKGSGIKLTNKFTFSMIPLFGNIFGRVIIPGKLSRFAELIVAVRFQSY